MRIPSWLQAFVALPSDHASELLPQENRSNENVFQCFLSWAMFGVKMSRVAEHADSLLFICRNHRTPPLLGGKHCMGCLGFRWSYADNVWVLACSANCTDAHLARLIAGAKKASLDVHDVLLASGIVQMFSVMTCLRPTCTAMERETDITCSLSRTDGLFAPSHERSGDGARQWS